MTALHPYHTAVCLLAVAVFFPWFPRATLAAGTNLKKVDLTLNCQDELLQADHNQDDALDVKEYQALVNELSRDTEALAHDGLSFYVLPHSLVATFEKFATLSQDGKLAIRIGGAHAKGAATESELAFMDRVCQHTLKAVEELDGKTLVQLASQGLDDLHDDDDGVTENPPIMQEGIDPGVDGNAESTLVTIHSAFVISNHQHYMARDIVSGHHSKLHHAWLHFVDDFITGVCEEEFMDRLCSTSVRTNRSTTANSTTSADHDEQQQDDDAEVDDDDGVSDGTSETQGSNSRNTTKTSSTTTNGEHDGKQRRLAPARRQRRLCSTHSRRLRRRLCATSAGTDEEKETRALGELADHSADIYSLVDMDFCPDYVQHAGRATCQTVYSTFQVTSYLVNRNATNIAQVADWYMNLTQAAIDDGILKEQYNDELETETQLSFEHAAYLPWEALTYYAPPSPAPTMAPTATTRPNATLLSVHVSFGVADAAGRTADEIMDEYVKNGTLTGAFTSLVDLVLQDACDEWVPDRTGNRANCTNSSGVALDQGRGGNSRRRLCGPPILHRRLCGPPVLHRGRRQLVRVVNASVELYNVQHVTCPADEFNSSKVNATKRTRKRRLGESGKAVGLHNGATSNSTLVSNDYVTLCYQVFGRFVVEWYGNASGLDQDEDEIIYLVEDYYKQVTKIAIQDGTLQDLWHELEPTSALRILPSLPACLEEAEGKSNATATQLTIYTAFIMSNTRNMSAALIDFGPHSVLHDALTSMVTVVLADACDDYDGKTDELSDEDKDHAGEEIPVVVATKTSHSSEPGSGHRTRRLCGGSDHSRRRRELLRVAEATVKIYQVDDTECPESTTKVVGRCQTVYGHFDVYWYGPPHEEESKGLLEVAMESFFGRDPDLEEVAVHYYTNITQSAIQEGALQEHLESMDPHSDFVVLGSAKHLFPQDPIENAMEASGFNATRISVNGGFVISNMENLTSRDVPIGYTSAMHKAVAWFLDEMLVDICSEWTPIHECTDDAKAAGGAGRKLCADTPGGAIGWGSRRMMQSHHRRLCGPTVVHRRRQLLKVVADSVELYEVEELTCPGDIQVGSAGRHTQEGDEVKCQVVHFHFDTLWYGDAENIEDLAAVHTYYTNVTEQVIKNGHLQTYLELVDPRTEFTIEGPPPENESAFHPIPVQVSFFLATKENIKAIDIEIGLDSEMRDVVSVMVDEVLGDVCSLHVDCADEIDSTEAIKKKKEGNNPTQRDDSKKEEKHGRRLCGNRGQLCDSVLEQGGHRRKLLDVVMDSIELYDIHDQDCPTSLKDYHCYEVDVNFSVLWDGNMKDPIAIVDAQNFYANLTRVAIDDGLLQKDLGRLAPELSFQVVGSAHTEDIPSSVRASSGQDKPDEMDEETLRDEPLPIPLHAAFIISNKQDIGAKGVNHSQTSALWVAYNMMVNQIMKEICSEFAPKAACSPEGCTDAQQLEWMVCGNANKHPLRVASIIDEVYMTLDLYKVEDTPCPHPSPDETCQLVFAHFDVIFYGDDEWLNLAQEFYSNATEAAIENGVLQQQLESAEEKSRFTVVGGYNVVEKTAHPPPVAPKSTTLDNKAVEVVEQDEMMLPKGDVTAIPVHGSFVVLNNLGINASAMEATDFGLLTQAFELLLQEVLPEVNISHHSISFELDADFAPTVEIYKVEDSECPSNTTTSREKIRCITLYGHADILTSGYNDIDAKLESLQKEYDDAIDFAIKHGQLQKHVHAPFTVINSANDSSASDHVHKVQVGGPGEIRTAFMISNYDGLQADDIRIHAGSVLDLAYMDFVEGVMDKLCPGMHACFPANTTKDDHHRRLCEDRQLQQLAASGCDGKFRRLDIEFDSSTAQIYKIEDSDCFPSDPDTATCQTVFAGFFLHLSGTDQDLELEQYSNALLTAIDLGFLQDSVDSIDPEAAFEVDGAVWASELDKLNAKDPLAIILNQDDDNGAEEDAERGDPRTETTKEAFEGMTENKEEVKKDKGDDSKSETAKKKHDGRRRVL